jgi:hypothetical protein
MWLGGVRRVSGLGDQRLEDLPFIVEERSESVS